MNAAEIRMLNAPNETRGWGQVPECPPIFQAKIAEMRAANLKTDKNVWTFDAPIPGARVTVETRQAVAPAVRRNEKSVEQLYFERTGHEYIDPIGLKIRLETMGRQIRSEATKVAAENAEAARNARLVNEELFPWLVN